MAKIIKKKFYEVEVPIFNEKFEVYLDSLESMKNKTIKLDVTRKLKGKSVEAIFTVKVENNKAYADPKKITLLPFFINHMMHKGISYVEDSFKAQTKESEVIIKPFIIPRKKVSRAVRNTLRNSAKNWLVDYLKTKDDYEAFSEILSGQIQKPLALKLKKIYPLAICEIRVFEIKKSLAGTDIKSEPIGEIEIKKEVKEDNGMKEIKEEITEKIEIKEKPKKSKKAKSEETPEAE